ncbi:toxic anion resistance protein, partial [Cytobacillus oceanisediminis]|uniref:toxic anion resistance protein n=1 Tax=Cytobacillus oceanisediminis TaxID=665099 RepID=UPI0037C15B01
MIGEENGERGLELGEEIEGKKEEGMIVYGREAEGKVVSFWDGMLVDVEKKDVGEVGEVMNDLMKDVNNMKPDEASSE